MSIQQWVSARFGIEIRDGDGYARSVQKQEEEAEEARKAKRLLFVVTLGLVLLNLILILILLGEDEAGPELESGLRPGQKVGVSLSSSISATAPNHLRKVWRTEW